MARGGRGSELGLRRRGLGPMASQELPMGPCSVFYRDSGDIYDPSNIHHN